VWGHTEAKWGEHKGAKKCFGDRHEVQLYSNAKKGSNSYRKIQEQPEWSGPKLEEVT